MNHWFRAPRAAAVSMCCLAAAGLPAFGGTASDGPVTVTMTLMNSHVTLGEPLVLSYKISSPSQQGVSLHMGKRDKTLDGPGADIVQMFRRDWLTMDMRPVAGRPLPALPDLRTPDVRDVEYGTQGLSRGNRYTISGYLVVGQWYTPSQPGNYTLTVHVHLPYAVLPDEEVREKIKPGLLDAAILSSGSALEWDDTLAVTIQEPDAARLQATAETLRKAALTETDGSKQSMAIQSLFTMPEAEAAPSWAALVNDPALFSNGKDVTLSELERVRSIKSADILARMLTGPKKPPTLLQERVCLSLAAMYRAGDPRMKSHIKQLLVAHGLPAP